MWKFWQKNKIFPTFKSVDTCAAEFEAKTPYCYSTYEIENEVIPLEGKKILILGRLESSEEFKEKKIKVVKKVEDIEKLKIAVRDITNEDISSRNLNKKTSGVVITEISNRSPLTNLLSVNDIIIEVQKSPVKSSSDLKRLVDNFFQKGEKTLLLTVINKKNQRRYLGVKIN